MPFIPVLCESKDCYTMFSSPFLLGENTNNVTITGKGKVCPCPKCGGCGTIPDGVYSSIEGQIFASLFDLGDINRINKLRNTLKRELGRNKSPKNIVKKLKKHHPKNKELWDKIPSNKHDALWWLNFIFAAAGSIAAVTGTAHTLLKNKEEVRSQIHHHYHYNFEDHEKSGADQEYKRIAPKKGMKI